MASISERTPRERETLVFSSPEEAQEFRERVAKREEQGASPGIKKKREALADVVADEFSRHGDAVGQYEHPWAHDEVEHGEAQELVNVAFADNLETALKLARKSAQYPRLIDLFHDVLTDQMYDELVAEGVNAQSPRSRMVLIGLGLICLLVVAAFLMFLI